MNTVIAVVVTAWGLVMAVALALQIRAIVWRRSSEGVSLAYFTVLFVGFVLWELYGLTQGDPVLIVVNAVSASVGLAAVLAILAYRGRPPIVAAPVPDIDMSHVPAEPVLAAGPEGEQG